MDRDTLVKAILAKHPVAKEEIEQLSKTLTEAHLRLFLRALNKVENNSDQYWNRVKWIA